MKKSSAQDGLAWDRIDLIIKNSLHEDLNVEGDITTLTLIPKSRSGKGEIVCKEEGIIAGLPVIQRVFQTVDHNLNWSANVQDGESVRTGKVIATIEGCIAAILTAERTALNLLQHLSGIATLTSKFVSAVATTSVTILDTRKTTPQLRDLDKYAVRLGGGENHRFGLFDMVLIKDNHIVAAGGIDCAIETCLKNMGKNTEQIKIEVETKTLQQVKIAMKYPIDRIMLDNMNTRTMKRAVEMIDHRKEVEASGNITLERIREVANTGVDYISVGALTHSAKPLDISLNVTLK